MSLQLCPLEKSYFLNHRHRLFTFVDLHLYGLRGPLDEPLFQFQVNYRRRPFRVFETCSSPGSITEHACKYPLQDTAKAEQHWKEYWALHYDSPDLSHLYADLAPCANYSLLLRPKKYLLSKAHKADHMRVFPHTFLTKAQRQALSDLPLDPHPWEGTPELRRALKRAAKASTQPASSGPASVMADIEDTTDLALAYGWEPDAYEMIWLSHPTSKKDNLRVLPEGQGKPGSIEALVYCHFYCRHIEQVAYLPADIELYFLWSARRRRRFFNDRTAKQRQTKPWTLDEPYFPDTPCAHAWVAENSDYLPSNWADLPEDRRFDLYTPEEYQ